MTYQRLLPISSFTLLAWSVLAAGVTAGAESTYYVVVRAWAYGMTSYKCVTVVCNDHTTTDTVLHTVGHEQVPSWILVIFTSSTCYRGYR